MQSVILPSPTDSVNYRHPLSDRPQPLTDIGSTRLAARRLAPEGDVGASKVVFLFVRLFEIIRG